ncbi:hypothetical protein Dimus_024732, partial [Dionaea muscipula]
MAGDRAAASSYSDTCGRLGWWLGGGDSCARRTAGSGLAISHPRSGRLSGALRRTSFAI